MLLCVVYLYSKTKQMKKVMMVLFFSSVTILSCTKENTNVPIIACKCNDGAIIPGSNPSVCGNYVLNTNGISVTLTHGGFKEFIRSSKTFCQVYPNSTYCLGRNY